MERFTRQLFTEYPEEFSLLEVTEIPYISRQIDKQTCYIIRPMTAEWIYQFSQRNAYNIHMGRKYITKDAFIKEVMGNDWLHPTEEFGYLMRWVSKYTNMKQPEEICSLYGICIQNMSEEFSMRTKI